MSATITSTFSTRLDTLTHAWTGTADASTSTEAVNGQTVTRTNDMIDPRFTNFQNWFGVDGASTFDFTSVAGALVYTAGPNGVAAPNGVIRTTNVIGANAGGAPKAAAFLVRNRGTSAVTLAARIVSSVVGANSPDVLVSPGETVRIVSPSSTGSTVNGYRPWLMHQGMPAGAILEISQAIAETVPDGGAPGAYFDGSTGTIPRYPETTTPLAIIGYEAKRTTRNVYHDVLGGGTDVTLRPAEPRSGVLRMLYADEASARLAQDMFTRSELFTLDDPEFPSTRMTFALEGDLGIVLDPDTQIPWLISVGYQEVSA